MQKNIVNRLSFTQGLTLLLCTSMIISTMFAVFPVVIASPQVQINFSTNSNSYYNMQTVGLYSNLTSSGLPKYDGVIAVEVDMLNKTTQELNPILYRSVKGSQNPNPALFNNNLQILSITPVKNLGFPPWVPVTSFTRGTLSYFNITIKNTGLETTGLITASIFDSASSPISVTTNGPYITPGVTSWGASLPIRTWTSTGTATIYVNIFKGLPSIYGAYPLVPEKSATFQVTARTQAQSLSVSQSVESYPSNGVVSTNTKGTYNFSWRIPPYTVLGDYVAYAASNYTNATPNFASAAFQVVATSTPPQASFTYTPTKPYANGTTYFDASASFSYNGSITNYKWNWGDGSPQNSTSSPLITHKFKTQGTFLVTLNVTDSQNLWCTSQKPVPVSGPTPPVAAFTFSPNPTWRNATTTFDASSSTPGWNGTGYPPIVRYVWNFGDGTPVTNITNPITTHLFTALGNFTTTLTVKDTRGLTAQTSRLVPVINVTQHPDIAVTSVTLDGQHLIGTNYYEPYKGLPSSLQNITVTVLNNGTSIASFSVTAYYFNGTTYPLGSHPISNLPSQSSTTFKFFWDTSVVKPTVNYVIKVNATILPGDTNLTNNQYNINALVKGQGDVNGDGVVDISDAALVGINWQKIIPPADARVDINGDGVIDISDAALVGINWQKVY